MNNNEFCKELGIKEITDSGTEGISYLPDMVNPNNFKKVLNVLLNNELFVECLYKAMVLRSIGISMEESYFQEIVTRISELAHYPKKDVLEKISLLEFS